MPVIPLLPPEARDDEHNELKLKREWLNALGMFGDGNHSDPKVMEGWLSIYTSANPNFPSNKVSAREQLLTNMKHLVNKYKDEKLSITIVGHSLGGRDRKSVV